MDGMRGEDEVCCCVGLNLLQQPVHELLLPRLQGNDALLLWLCAPNLGAAMGTPAEDQEEKKGFHNLSSNVLSR